MLSGDEEVGGFNGVKRFVDAGYKAEVCILPDAGEEYGNLSVAAKGMYNVRIVIQGKAHHGSRPWEGDAASAKIVHFLHDFESLFGGEPREASTMTVATLNAGDAINTGPSTAGATLDIRYSDKQDLMRIDTVLKQLLSKYDGAIVDSFDVDDFHLDTQLPVVRQFIELYQQQIGHPIKYTIAPGSSDAPFLAAGGIPTIMFRPTGGGAHGDEEWISKASLEQFYALLKRYILKVGNR